MSDIGSQDHSVSASTAWTERHEDLLSRLEGTIDYHHRISRDYELYHSWISIALIVCAALTPAFVLLNSINTGEGGHDFLKILFLFLAVVTPIAVSVLEGIRKIFRFGESFAESHSIMVRVLRLKDEYVEACIDCDIGSEDWKIIYKNTVGRYNVMIEDATGKWLEKIVSASQTLQDHVLQSKNGINTPTTTAK